MTPQPRLTLKRSCRRPRSCSRGWKRRRRPGSSPPCPPEGASHSGCNAWCLRAATHRRAQGQDPTVLAAFASWTVIGRASGASTLVVTESRAPQLWAWRDTEQQLLTQSRWCSRQFNTAQAYALDQHPILARGGHSARPHLHHHCIGFRVRQSDALPCDLQLV